MPANSTATAPRAVIHLYRDDLEACVVAALNRLPIDDRERVLRRHGGRNALLQHRLDERDNLLIELAAHYDLPSGRKIARAINADLRHHRIDTSPPTDSKRVLLRRILVLIGDGKLPGAVQIRSILAGAR
jgi:hypothetical protein